MDEVRRRLADADRRVALLADDRPAGEPDPQPHQVQAVLLARQALARAAAYLELADLADPEAPAGVDG